jgi:hypothetical protein
MKIRNILAFGLRGKTPEGGWTNELQPEDCVHTLIAVQTDGMGQRIHQRRSGEGIAGSAASVVCG